MDSWPSGCETWTNGGEQTGGEGGVYKVPSLLGPWISDRVSNCQGQAACQGGRSKKPADTSSIRILKPHPRSGTVWMATGSNQGSGNRGVAQRGPMHRSSSSETVTEHWPLGQHAVVPGGSWELGAGSWSGIWICAMDVLCAHVQSKRETAHSAEQLRAISRAGVPRCGREAETAHAASRRPRR